MKGKRELISIVIICLILLLVSSLFAVSSIKAAPAKTLEIGVLKALTGFGSGAEMLLWEGQQVTEKWLNEHGGITIKGQKYLIKLVVEDIKGTADGAVAAANKLVYDHKVKFIVGDVMPFTLAAAGTVTEPAKVLRCSEYNVCMPSEYGPNTPYTFVGDLGSLEYMNGLINYLADSHPDVKTTVILHPDDGADRYVVPQVEKLAKARGITPIGNYIAWPLDTVDFTPVIAKALARKPDTLSLVNGWPAAMGGMLKAAREAGFTGLIICNHPCKEVADVAGPEVSTGFIGIGVVMDDPSNISIIKDFSARFNKEFGHSLWYNLWGADCLFVLVKAIEAAQSLDPTIVRDKWEKMKTIDSLYGPSYIGGLKTYGINHTVYHAVGIQTLMDNQVKHAQWIDITVP